MLLKKNNIRKTLILILFLTVLTLSQINFLENVYATPLSFQLSLREHKNFALYNPESTFDKPASSELRGYTSNLGMGKTWIFFSAPRTFLNGKYIRFRWSSPNGYASMVYDVKIFDGSYSRSSSTDFPDGANIPTKGKGLLQTVRSKTGVFAYEIIDALMALSTGNQSSATIMFQFEDGWNGQNGQMQIDYIEINSGSGGSGINYYLTHCTNSVVMEVTGTTGDYGYCGTETVYSNTVTFYYTSNGVLYRNGTQITNGSIIDVPNQLLIEALPAFNCTFLYIRVNATDYNTNPKAISIQGNSTIWGIFGTIPSSPPADYSNYYLKSDMNSYLLIIFIIVMIGIVVLILLMKS